MMILLYILLSPIFGAISLFLLGFEPRWHDFVSQAILACVFWPVAFVVALASQFTILLYDTFDGDEDEN